MADTSDAYLCRTCGGKFQPIAEDSSKEATRSISRMLCHDCLHKPITARLVGATKPVVHAQAAMHALGEMLMSHLGRSTFTYSPLNITQTLSALCMMASPSAAAAIKSVVPMADSTVYSQDVKDFGDCYGMNVFLAKGVNLCAEVSGVVMRFSAVFKDSIPTVEEANHLIEVSTRGMLKNVVPERSFDDPDLRMVLINTLFIDCKWATPMLFDVAETRTDKFRNMDGSAAQCQMMTARNKSVLCYWNSKTVGVVLPIQSDPRHKLAVALIQNLGSPLPNSNVDTLQFHAVLNGCNACRVNLQVPKFTSKPILIDLVKHMPKMACADIFNGARHPFPCLGHDVCVNMWLHAATFEISESGVKGAAASVVSCNLCCERPQATPMIRFDGPFMTAVYDMDTGDQLLTTHVDNL
jgi:hypothetical protein